MYGHYGDLISILSSKITKYLLIKNDKNSNFLHIVVAVVIIVTSNLQQSLTVTLINEATPTICNLIAQGNEIWSNYCLQWKNDYGHLLLT